jgi:hypothetical protein
MQRPGLGITLRQASLVRSGAVASVLVSLLYAYAVPRDPDLALADVTRVGPIQVMAVSRGGFAPDPNSWLTAEPPRDPSLRTYLPLLQSEFGVYPDGMIARSGLRRLVICSELAWGGRRLGGMADVDAETVYLDLDASGDPEDLRHSIHHEFFHMIDSRWGLLRSDPQWARLNIAGFKYGSGGESMQDDPTARLPDNSVAGFLNSYSRSGAEEDKAEIFAHMLASPGVLSNRMARDALLSSKHLVLKIRLREFCPDMDDEFWERVRNR